MIESDVPSDVQARFVTEPRDADGNPVTLDPGAFEVSVLEGSGTFEYNSATNGLVFRLEDDATGNPVTRYSVTVDGQPGAGVVNLPVEVVLRNVAPVPDPAVVVGEGLAFEAKGTPA